MEFLRQLQNYRQSQRNVCSNSYYTGDDNTLTYEQLMDYSDRLAYWLQSELGEDKSPLVVFGHKHPFMLVYFLACVKSGRAYCPVDSYMPAERIQAIVEAVAGTIVLTTEPLPFDYPMVTVAYAKAMIDRTTHAIDPGHYVKEDDTFYIIFTSGSTGAPKGVCISAANLQAYLDWFVPLLEVPDEQHEIFIGQPPFSFDLSVMFLYPAMAVHGTIVQLDKTVQTHYQQLFEALHASQLTVWISTPSFVETCLADPSFDATLLPQVQRFIFCGEKLQAKTVEQLHQRFPSAKVYNSYGPTESTVMMTWMEMTPEVVSQYYHNLPVGYVKPGTQLLLEMHPNHEGQGEMMIVGDTVAQGYYQNPDLTAQKFFDTESMGVRGYRTGDLGHFEHGMLFCDGRIDFQVKLHGYRIELEDIDQNLMKNPLISQAVTLPKYEEGKVKSLTAYVVYHGEMTSRFAVSKQIKSTLKQQLPDYMIPKKIVCLEMMPLNQNGKVDRKALEAQLYDVL